MFVDRATHEKVLRRLTKQAKLIDDISQKITKSSSHYQSIISSKIIIPGEIVGKCKRRRRILCNMRMDKLFNIRQKK